MKLEDALKMKEISDLRLKAVLEIIHTASFINNLHIKYLRPYKISPQQYNILRILRGSYPKALTMQSIRNRMVDKTPHITRMVDKLEKQKFVKRERSSDDRRIFLVKITKKGLEIMAELDITQKDFLDFTERLNERETEELSYLLEKLRN